MAERSVGSRRGARRPSTGAKPEATTARAQAAAVPEQFSDVPPTPRGRQPERSRMPQAASSPQRVSGPPRRPASTRVRARLLRLRRAVDDELAARRVAAGLEPARATPIAIDRLSSFGRELPRLVNAIPKSLATLRAVNRADLVLALRLLAQFIEEQRRLADPQRRIAAEIDDFGFDRQWTESLMPAIRLLYRHWWRVQTSGVENVPAQGRALLVSNHAGVIPYDGAMIRTAVLDEHPTPRHARALIMNGFFSVPVASWFLRRTGNTLAHPADAEELLRRDELVLVFPEGVKGPGKLWRERYRLRRFGRGGFVEVALRTGSPIVPVSVVGSEEIHPMIADLSALHGILGVPYFPVTPTFPLLGLFGLVPLPSSWRIHFGTPITLDGYGPGAADDPAVVLEVADRVRDTVQAGVWRLLEERGSIFA
ncbi:MAG: lysophospholipid acyltransferase family protein [Candidatus Dormibacteria bacterium]